MMWPREDEALLARYLQEGKKAVEIHRLFPSRSFFSVVGKIARMRETGPNKIRKTSLIHNLAVGQAKFFVLTPRERHNWHKVARLHGMAIMTRRWQESGQSGFMIKRIS